MKNNKQMFAYVGSRTTRERNARGDGISVFEMDAASGALRLRQQLKELVNPSFLALNSAQDRLYTVHGDGDEVSVFTVDPSTGELTFLMRQVCGGKNPVHLALNPTERFLIVSDHLGSGTGGTLKVMPIAADSKLEPVSQSVTLEGKPGPHRKEQPHAKPHFNPFDRSGRYVAVPDKGLDRIFVFAFEQGRLQPAAQPWVDTREGAGPRHIVFAPSNRHAYAVNELDSTVTAYAFDQATGALSPLQILPTLPDSYTGNNRCAGIQITSDGAYLYASNRGHDSLARFKVDAKTGRLQFLGCTLSDGKTPRFFTLTPDENLLYALNEDSDTVTTFRVNRSNGDLTRSDAIACGSPVCMVFKTR